VQHHSADRRVLWTPSHRTPDCSLASLHFQVLRPRYAACSSHGLSPKYLYSPPQLPPPRDASKLGDPCVCISLDREYVSTTVREAGSAKGLPFQSEGDVLGACAVTIRSHSPAGSSNASPTRQRFELSLGPLMTPPTVSSSSYAFEC